MAWTLGNLLTVIIGKLDVLKNLTHAFQAESISGLFILFSSLVAFDGFLVSTGVPRSSATQTSEVINTDNSSLTCKDLEEYPLQVSGAVGSNMASLPVILENAAPGDADCMAIDANLEVLDNLTQCYRMESGKWNLFANLAQGYVLY